MKSRIKDMVFFELFIYTRNKVHNFMDMGEFSSCVRIVSENSCLFNRYFSGNRIEVDSIILKLFFVLIDEIAKKETDENLENLRTLLNLISNSKTGIRCKIDILSSILRYGLGSTINFVYDYSRKMGGEFFLDFVTYYVVKTSSIYFSDQLRFLEHFILSMDDSELSSVVERVIVSVDEFEDIYRLRGIFSFIETIYSFGNKDVKKRILEIVSTSLDPDNKERLLKLLNSSQEDSNDT
jgi:hypothetical protein